MVYLPASSRSAGMVKRPCALVITLVVMLESAFLALTTTPSIAPSSADVTWPVSWAIACGETRTSASVAVETPDIHFAIMKDLLVAFSNPAGAVAPSRRPARFRRKPKVFTGSVQGCSPRHFRLGDRMSGPYLRHHPHRHARACPGHPRLSCGEAVK